MNAPVPGALRDVKLTDKYRLPEGRVFMSGNQVLVRLPIQQRLRDAAAGRNTAGYVSGYRGSPLGRYDMEMWQAQRDARREPHPFSRRGERGPRGHGAVGQPVRRQLSPVRNTTACSASGTARVPGSTARGDVLRHANSAGTSPWGGVLAIAGDDHGAKSSTITNFSDQIFTAVGIPVLYPSNAQEILDFGLHGIAMSRYSGCWVAHEGGHRYRSRAAARSRSASTIRGSSCRRTRPIRRWARRLEHPPRRSRRSRRKSASTTTSCTRRWSTSAPTT